MYWTSCNSLLTIGSGCPRVKNSSFFFFIFAGLKDVTSLITHAREWEQSGQYKQAIQCYMKISQSSSADRETISKSLLKAADLTSKFVETSEAIVISRSLGPKLLETRHYGTAAQLYMACDLNKEAIDAFIAGGEWSNARKAARELEPGLELYVENRCALKLMIFLLLKSANCYIIKMKITL